MRTIVHISDIHFGRTDAASVDSLVSAFSDIKPNLIVISGDLTQRAKVKEFESAQALLRQLTDHNFRYFIIPGNHDIEPLYKPLTRATDPYKSYRKFISDVLEPTYHDDEIAIASINTVEPGNISNGLIKVKLMQKTEEWLAQFPSTITKIVVTHHPFDLPSSMRRHRLVGRAKVVVERLAKHTVDIFLSGHYHLSGVVHTAERYKIDNYSAIAISAGTLSTRQRGELQSFNVITIDRPNITVETKIWNPDKKIFNGNPVKDFIQTEGCWQQKVTH